MTGIERLRAVFERASASGTKVLVPYVTAGDPDLATTHLLLNAVAAGGADIIELGVPFSDPMADGPVLQLAAERALKSPFSLDALLELVADFNAAHRSAGEGEAPPIILFGYYNPFFRYGHERLAAAAAAAGACGVLCVDLPPEEAAPLHTALAAEGLALIPLVTPVSGDDRVDRARELSSAFAYYVSATGVTGLALDGGSIAARVAHVRERLDCSLVVGFGVCTPADAARMAQGADGVVVGTALVALAHETPPPDKAPAVTSFIRRLKSAL